MSKGEGGAFEADFIIVPGNVLRDSIIGPAAKLLYGRLKLYAGKDGKAYPKHETLAKEICLAGRQVRNLLIELRAAGWIDWVRTRTSCVYTVHSDRHKSADQARQDVADLSAEKCRSRSAENCRQKRSIENHHQKEKCRKETPRLRAQVSGQPEPEKTTPFSKKADDENPTPRRAPHANDEMEFNARMAERHGRTVDVGLLRRDVAEELNGVPLAEWLDADTKATTNPRKLTNPAGHYRTLARKIGNRKTTAALESVMETQQRAREFLKQSAPAPFQAPTCCIEGKAAGGEYCTCKVGELKKQLDERKAKNTEAA